MKYENKVEMPCRHGCFMVSRFGKAESNRLNAFKTISMRIRGAKTEMEALGEDTSGMAESVASMREEVKALSGVDIMLNENTFKSTYQIMDELAYKWEDLSDIAQANSLPVYTEMYSYNIFNCR